MAKRKIIVSSVVLFSCIILILLLFYNGIMHFNNPSDDKYPICGVDVSSFQGQIDWPTLAGQGLSFAFIKATEGSSFVDPNFAINYENALKTSLRVGAYHFFSYDSPGSTQADNFIAAVPKADGMLPPVVDIEFYGDKAKNPPDKESVQRELTVLLKKLEENYGFKPILYATNKSHKLYIANSYSDYDIWIRDVFSSPTLSDGRSWTFWQYTDRVKLNGYTGKESFIDMNVFYDTKEEFEAYP